MDQIGYEGVDCGSLADSWRIEAAYVGRTPEGLAPEEQIEWYAQDTAAVVTRADVERMAAQANRHGPAGGNPGNLHPAWTRYVAQQQ